MFWDKEKIVEADIGLLDEIFELCKNLISIETHSFNSFLSSKDEKWLKLSQKAREIRTRYLSLITKKNNSQGWCISKHIIESCMRLQECYTRYLSVNQLNDAKLCSEDYESLFMLFMEIYSVGLGESGSSA